MVASPTLLVRTSRSRAESVVGALRRRLAGAYEVDPWGLDTEVSGAAGAVARLRWSVTVVGADHVPDEGPVLLVANQRLATLAPLAAVLELGRASGRALRFAGVPDVEPLATIGRRLGGVIERPDEVAGLLRAGEPVLVWCGVLLRGGARVGTVRPELLAPAVASGATVLPVAISGRRFGRGLRVEVGAPITRRRRRRAGPLAAVELADEAREAVQALLDEAAPHHWPYR